MKTVLSILSGLALGVSLLAGNPVTAANKTPKMKACCVKKQMCCRMKTKQACCLRHAKKKS